MILFVLTESPSSAGPVENSHLANRPYKRITIDDAKRWTGKYRNGTSILRIAKEEGVDPGTASSWLKRLGLEIKQGQHRVRQLPLQYSEQILAMVGGGAAHVIELVNKRVWGIVASEIGTRQLGKFCDFVRMHRGGVGVEEIARKLSLHRSTVTDWREGTEQPYLIKTLSVIVNNPVPEGLKLLPLRLSSGGNSPSDWIKVPATLSNYEELVSVMNQLNPVEEAFKRGGSFGITRQQLLSLKMELVGYLLGVMVGDASKLGGEQSRFTSSHLDLQLTTKQPTNLNLGEFVCICVNIMGLAMERTANKKPSGTTKFGKQPSEAFRWASERSPILAWLYYVCIGLSWQQNTSTNEIRMDWILRAPPEFRKRFVQGLADSDATVKPYEVVITSVPNAEFTSTLLQGLGLTSAHVVIEGGRPLRTMVSRRQGATLPIFNEFVKGYSYRKLMIPFKR